MEKYEVYKVFTPTLPARLTFVEREGINTKLVNALRTPGKQVVVYGQSGSGKTTLLLNKLHQLYDDHLTSRCMKSVSFEALLLDAFDQLSAYYCSEKIKSSTSTKSAGLSQDYFTIKSQISASKSEKSEIKAVRIIPPQLTAQALGRFIGASGKCWVLEDFHKIDESERSKLSQLMKVFMDMADEYPALKIVAIGAVDTARQVVEFDSEMKNRVAEIHVPLMENKEVQKIIEKGGELLRAKFNAELMEGVSSYSNGLASVCHHLCLNICTTNNIYETLEAEKHIDSEALDQALGVYLEESSDTLKKAFDIAFRQQSFKKYDNNRLIIKAISEFGPEGALRSEIFEKIKEVENKYPQGNLARFLNQLCNKKEIALIKYDAINGRYLFSDPIYRVFALVYFRDNGPKIYGPRNNRSIEFYFENSKEDVRKQIAEKISKEIKIYITHKKS